MKDSDINLHYNEKSQAKIITAETVKTVNVKNKTKIIIIIIIIII